jgi:Acetyltransferase (GNAT) domain
MSYTIKTMTRADLDVAIEWAAREGWNPGLNDGDVFYNADPNGYFVGRKGDDIAGVVSSIAYDEQFGFIGFYIVREEDRNTDLGVRLGLMAMKYMGDRNIGLDGVVERVENYKKLGFNYAYQNIRWEGKFDGVDTENTNITRIGRVNLNQLFKLDRECFPAPREAFVRSWVSMTNAWSYGYQEDGNLRGYGVIRACRNGFKIGPLFADNAEVAHELFKKLVSQTKGAPVFYDTPAVNQAAVDIANQYKMEKSFETARMYSKQAPDIKVNKIFGVTSFELG